MENLSAFEGDLEAVIGRPTEMRPFVCEGSPLRCRVFIVGFNPATAMTASFWDFWRPGYGFDKAAWFREYKRERSLQPLKPGKTRRNEVSNTRRVMDWVIAAVPRYACLETNIHALPSKDKRGLLFERRETAPFRFLLERIRPAVVVAHGEDAIAETKRLSTDAGIIPVKHFSRGWSEAAARALGAQIEAAVPA